MIWLKNTNIWWVLQALYCKRYIYRVLQAYCTIQYIYIYIYIYNFLLIWSSSSAEPCHFIPRLAMANTNVTAWSHWNGRINQRQCFLPSLCFKVYLQLGCTFPTYHMDPITVTRDRFFKDGSRQSYIDCQCTPAALLAGWRNVASSRPSAKQS